MTGPDLPGLPDETSAGPLRRRGSFERMPRGTQLRIVALELLRQAVEASDTEPSDDTLTDWYIEVARSKPYRALLENTASPAIVVLIEVRELVRTLRAKGAATRALDATRNVLLGLPPEDRPR